MANNTTKKKSSGGLGCAAAVLLAAPGAAHCAEIVMEHSAVDKLLVQALFKDNGRHMLVKTACLAYLESPATTLDKGRVWIRSRITAKVGVPAGQLCVGATLSSWTTVSGLVVAEGGKVQLTDIRVEEIEDGKLSYLLSSGWAPSLPSAVQLDVAKSVSSMLKSASPQMESKLEMLQIQSVSADKNQLGVRFDFKLVAR